MKDNTKVLAAFLIGAAVGGAVAWFLISDNEEIMEDIKDLTGKLKDDLKDTVEKGKRFVENIKDKAEGYLSEQ